MQAPQQQQPMQSQPQSMYSSLLSMYGGGGFQAAPGLQSMNIPGMQMPPGWGPSMWQHPGNAFGTHGMRGPGGQGAPDKGLGGMGGQGKNGGQNMGGPRMGSPGGFLPQMYPPMWGGPQSMPIPGMQSQPQLTPMYMPSYGQW